MKRSTVFASAIIAALALSMAGCAAGAKAEIKGVLNDPTVSFEHLDKALGDKLDCGVKSVFTADMWNYAPMDGITCEHDGAGTAVLMVYENADAMAKGVTVAVDSGVLDVIYLGPNWFFAPPNAESEWEEAAHKVGAVTVSATDVKDYFKTDTREVRGRDSCVAEFSSHIIDVLNGESTKAEASASIDKRYPDNAGLFESVYSEVVDYQGGPDGLKHAQQISDLAFEGELSQRIEPVRLECEALEQK